MILGGSMKKFFVILAFLVIGAVFYFYATDDSANTPIEAIGQFRNQEITQVYDEIDVDNGKLIFYVRGDNPEQRIINAEYAKKTWKGWKWGYGGGHSIPSEKNPYKENHWSSQYFYSTKGTAYESPFPMLFGALYDKEIQSVSVESTATGETFKAAIIENQKFPFRVWYLFLTEKQGTDFTIRALTSKNDVHSVKEEINEPLPR